MYEPTVYPVQLRWIDNYAAVQHIEFHRP